MTIGCIISVIIGVIILVVGFVLCIAGVKSGDTGFGIGSMIVALILAAALIIIPFVYMNTETGKRALKDQQSNFGDGINRTVEVYDVSGNLIKQYDGKFDVETSNSNGTPYIVFDDENNKRHIIYYTTGTVIIDEK